ncbi:MAG: hypothetical protein J6Y60_10380, partial [Treponema sp.]|nr:hypothetical protein [Treponema sp.]
DLYSFTWSWSSTYNGYYSDSKASGIKETSSTSVVPNILSNQFATYSMSQIVDGGISLLTSGATKGRFFIKTQQYESASAFRESLNGAYVVYELATPQTYQLTPQELKLLKQYNYITTNGTTISLKYQPDNVIGEAIGVSEEYTDRKVNGKIYTKTVTGTVWVNAQSARMLILYNESEAWDRIPIAAFYSTYKCTPYYVYENDTYTWSILIHKSDGTNATDISSGASITLQVVYMEA